MYAKFIISNAKLIILNEEFIIFDAEFIVFDANRYLPPGNIIENAVDITLEEEKLSQL